MHEFTITQKLLDEALNQAKTRRIVNVNFLIGSFSEEREETIQFYWRDLAKGTSGEGAQLHFEHLQADMVCFGCGGGLSLDHEESICKYCQKSHLPMLSVEDVSLESVEVK